MLKNISLEGVGYMYGGPWASIAAKAVGAQGGNITLEDYLNYRPSFPSPVQVTTKL